VLDLLFSGNHAITYGALCKAEVSRGCHQQTFI